jgi:AraC-like DNA-binding protein
MRNIKILWLLIHVFPLSLLCQDTNFVNKHTFSTPVRNVFKRDNTVYVKTGDGLYKRENNTWQLQKTKFEKTFVFYDKGFYENDYIPTQFVFDAQPMAYLIPQSSLSNSTMAQLDDQLFVSAGGCLFEYSINKFYKHFYKEHSIRNIFIEKGLKVVSTYSGIFINDTIKAPTPFYSNGYFCKIRGKYYLSSDPLFLYTWPTTFQKIESATNVFAGYSRKLVEYNHSIYSLNTKSVNQFDSAFQLMPIQQGYEYHDFEVVDSVLLFCTSTGEVFQYNGKTTKLLFNVHTRVRNIYKFRHTVYFATDAGVYTIQNMQPNTLAMLADLPFSVMVIVDLYRNTWIATENGLYILPDKKKEPIEFIKGVEFNRGALTYYEDDIYAGSIDGLYVIDVYSIVKNFLPLYLNKKSIVEDEQKRKLLIIASIIVILLLFGGYVYYYKRNRKATLTTSAPKEDPVLTLSKIGQDIKNNNIMTVEGLAEYYKTNTVQLNRLFKTFEITPGKFMKKVKLDLAKELLKNGEQIEDVVIKTGYSASYLKKELNL